MNAKVEALAAQVKAMSIENLLLGASMLAAKQDYDAAETFARVALDRLMARRLFPQAKA